MVFRVLLLEFEKGYHVGWREPRVIVDHTTVLRALLYYSYLLGLGKCVELIKGGSLRSSALLPAVKIGDSVRILFPFPRLPSYVKASEIRKLWTTPQGIQYILDFVKECVESSGTPIVDEVRGDSISILCHGANKSVELKQIGDVVCVDSDCKGFTSDHRGFFERVEEYRNRVDRLSGSADVFVVKGIKPNTLLWIAFEGNEEAIICAENLFKLLEQTGLGGLRSRGWGRFRVVDAKIDEQFLDTVTKMLGWSKGYNLLLGSMSPGGWMDLPRSFLEVGTIMGRSGPPQDEYVLPVIKILDVGSLVYVVNIPGPKIISLNNNRALLLFNPVVLHA
ncbi:MAG: hypothetical protein QXQ93_08840 [Ignisphaera sp.]